MDFADAAQAISGGNGQTLVPAGSPVRQERETTYWILSYDWETEQFASRSRDSIRSLKLNPVWRSQTDLGLAAWIDVDAHNALASPLAKGIHLKLVLAAAQGQLPRTHVAPLERWINNLGVQSKEDHNKIARRFRDAIDSLVAADILRAGEVRSPARGTYELALEPGALPRHTKTSRGLGSLDPVRTRVLLWHLSQVGMTVAEGRALISQHGMDVEQVLRRVHYERTVKGGVRRPGARNHALRPVDIEGTQEAVDVRRTRIRCMARSTKCPLRPCPGAGGSPTRWHRRPRGYHPRAHGTATSAQAAV